MLDTDTLFQEAACLGCNSNASMADMLVLALLQRMVEAATSTVPATQLIYYDGSWH